MLLVVERKVGEEPDAIVYRQREVLIPAHGDVRILRQAVFGIEGLHAFKRHGRYHYDVILFETVDARGDLTDLLLAMFAVRAEQHDDDAFFLWQIIRGISGSAVCEEDLERYVIRESLVRMQGSILLCPGGKQAAKHTGEEQKFFHKCKEKVFRPEPCMIGAKAGYFFGCIRGAVL